MMRTKGKRGDEEIGIAVVRAGEIIGKHQVIFSSQAETIEITHTAHDRTVFAKGALRAATWIKDKKPGLYDMQDLRAQRTIQFAAGSLAVGLVLSSSWSLLPVQCCSERFTPC